jgi:hypothetical protein
MYGLFDHVGSVSRHRPCLESFKTFLRDRADSLESLTKHTT